MAEQRVPIPRHPGFWRRGDTVYFKYRDRRRRQRWASAATIAQARRLKAALETDVARGEDRPRSRVTFEGYATAWLETYQGRTRRRIAEQTRADYRARLEQDAIPFFGRALLTEIEPQDVKAFAAHVAGRRRLGRGEGPLSDNTVRLALAPVKALFATAFEEGAIRVNPAAGIRIVSPREDVLLDEEHEGEVKALSESELAAILAEIPEGWRLFFDVLVHLGLRIGELLELRWRDVDLGDGTVRIRRAFYRGRVGQPKTRFGRRTLRLEPELARELWQLRKATRAAAGELVFTAPGGGRVNASNVMSRILKPAAVRAGVGEWIRGSDPGKRDRAETWVGFHTFRHTCATALFRRGWNAKQVQLWLGHHKASFTVDTYVHLLEEDLPEPPRLGLVEAAEGGGGTRGDTQSTREHPKPAAAGPA